MESGKPPAPFLMPGSMQWPEERLWLISLLLIHVTAVVIAGMGITIQAVETVSAVGISRAGTSAMEEVVQRLHGQEQHTWSLIPTLQI